MGTKISLFVNKHLKDHRGQLIWAGHQNTVRIVEEDKAGPLWGRELSVMCALGVSGGQRPRLEQTATGRASNTSQFITCRERSHCHQQHCAVLLTIQVQ